MNFVTVFATHALSAAALALLGATAEAQPVSRPQPGALAPPPAQVDQPDPAAAFALANEAAGRPRIAVYWNRELTDELVSRTERYLTHTYSHEARSNEISGRQDAASGVRAVRENANRALIAETVDWRLESAFYAPFLEAGARLVDRNLILRTIRQSQPDDTEPNRQLVETEALQGKADYLVEVLMTNDASALAGMRFRITTKNIETGEVVSLFSTQAATRAKPSVQFIATDAGYEQETLVPEVALEDVGRQLARETMASLARARLHLKRRPR